MFRGNKPVLILPAILMIVMFIGGYQFLQGSEAATNEELQEVIDIQLEANRANDDLRIRANWDWTIMPAEGLYGEDYIGIALIDQDTGEARTDLEFVDSRIEVLFGDQVIEEAEGTVVDNGIIFAFSNKMDENVTYGNLGRVEVTVGGEELQADDVQLHFLHTWTEHSPLDKEDATFAQPTFGNAANVPYWITTRP
ncbi:hypothetical protein [Halalkalibacter nanhaiisediminis]|uniref:Uncharacterized protein n=1 Tax=Halalkalibacter nanhaiisediminis TaxID=688079 RepID=A0A562QMD3_9BACI|nr:hypothetical protein [Halalkalibacter nanhaiisediminis]TWI57833.1 hypothetical protein IQ10_01162 [Halalkalibacter nanhaiisediminis]